MKKPNRAFSALRQRAAEREAERLRATGMDIIVVGQRDPASPSPLHKIPGLFERSELENYEREKRLAPAQGIRPETIPPPVPVLAYDAWSFYATCPNCKGRRIDVNGIGYVDGRNTDVIEGLQKAQKARATCLRPRLEGREFEPGGRFANKNCGWSGLVEDLHFLCLECGTRKPGAQRGTCASCVASLAAGNGAPSSAAKKASKKKASKKKAAKRSAG